MNQDVSGLTVNIRSSVDVRGALTVMPTMDAWRVTLEPEGSLAKLGFGMRAGPVGARFSMVAKDGTYRIQNVPPGHYRVNVSGLPAGLYVDSVSQNGTTVTDSGFDAGSEPPTPLQIAVRSGAGVVEGTVAPGAVVAVVPMPEARSLFVESFRENTNCLPGRPFPPAPTTTPISLRSTRIPVQP